MNAGERRATVRALRERGLTLKAIADVVGASLRTVSRDLDAGAQPQSHARHPDPDRGATLLVQTLVAGGLRRDALAAAAALVIELDRQATRDGKGGLNHHQPAPPHRHSPVAQSLPTAANSPEAGRRG